MNVRKMVVTIAPPPPPPPIISVLSFWVIYVGWGPRAEKNAYLYTHLGLGLYASRHAYRHIPAGFSPFDVHFVDHL